MKKREQSLNQKIKVKWLFLLLLALVVGGYLFVSQGNLRAFTIINKGEFSLKAENRWDGTEKKVILF